MMMVMIGSVTFLVGMAVTVCMVVMVRMVMMMMLVCHRPDGLFFTRALGAENL